MKIFWTHACTMAIAQSAIVVTLVACSTSRPSTTASSQPDLLAASPIAGSPSPSPIVTGDPFTKGVDKAASATSLSQSAQTPEDWNLVLTQWQRAIAFMKAVPSSSQNYAAARKLLASYQQDLLRAQQQARRGGAIAPLGDAKGSVKGGIPLIAGGQTSASSNVSKEPIRTMEGAITISALLQQQTEFFAKQKRFAVSLAELGTSIPAATSTYVYSTSVVQSKQAIATATAKQDGLPSYTGALLATKDNENNDAVVPAICFASNPPKTPPPPPQLAGRDIQCPAGSSKL